MKFLGTNERICLVKGKIASVLKVSDVILEKIREKVDNNTPSDIFDHKGMERKNEVSEISNIEIFYIASFTFRYSLIKKSSRLSSFMNYICFWKFELISVSINFNYL